jgi:hypothetical protein
MTSISDLQSYEQRIVLRQSFRPTSGPGVAPRRILHPRFEIVACVPQTVPANESGTRNTPLVARRKRQQGDVAGLLDGAGQTALVRRANARQTARYNLAAFGHKALQQTDIPIGDGVDLLGAELANLLAAEELAASAGTAAGAPAGTPAWASGASAGTAGSALWCWCACFGRLSLRFICHSVPRISFSYQLSVFSQPSLADELFEGVSDQAFGAADAVQT